MTFSVCAIGCGGMATMAHGPSYARYAALHPDVNLAACCDLNAERAESFRARFGFQRRYSDMEAMLEAERPDAVCLIAPEALTCELSCQVLTREVPLMMEKPPGRTIAEIDRMIAVAESDGAKTRVAFNRRSMPLMLRLRALLAESVAPGELQHIRVDFTRTGRADPDFSATAIHGIDSARFLADSDFREIRFRYQPLTGHGSNVANVFLDGIFESGVTAQLNFCPMAGDISERVTVYADDQTFQANLPIWDSLDAPGRLRRFRKNECLLDAPCEIAASGEEGFVVNGFYGENADFFDAIREGRTPMPDLKRARQSVEIMEAYRERIDVYQSQPIRNE